MTPEILMADYRGTHNSADQTDRLTRAGSYQDLSTVCIVPAIAPIHPKVVLSWMSMMTPMNQKFTRIFMMNMEVGAAYNAAIEGILANPELSKWKYVLTLETDNMPPPDGLLKLYESIKNYDAVGGLYWVKGELGAAMIYGDPKVMPKNFIPQIPRAGEIQPACGLGMGFTLFRLSMFKKLPKPWFKTLQEYTPGVGVSAFTQDLYFFDYAGREGFRFASDNRVLVGHFSAEEDRAW
jgi:hypothetical protein